MTNLLEQLGDKYKPTKREHDYLKHYWRHFGDRRLEIANVVEIGVETNKSVGMWEEFFPNAIIHGIDINPACKQFEGGRIKIYIGDQGDAVFMKKTAEQIGANIDIVIDDGSHVPEHQIKTFSLLFPRMSTHGIYVIEDTGGVVGDENLVTVMAMLELAKNIMYWPAGRQPSSWPGLGTFPTEATWLDKNVVGLAVYRWLVLIMKGQNPEDNPMLGR